MHAGEQRGEESTGLEPVRWARRKHQSPKAPVRIAAICIYFRPDRQSLHLLTYAAQSNSQAQSYGSTTRALSNKQGATISGQGSGKSLILSAVT